jgi:alkyl hydroperoxide reductase subunit F
MIIGGGPAGLSAAIYTSRKRLSTILISKDIGGQMNLTLSIENYLGYQFISAQELVMKFQDQVNQFPIDQKIGYAITRIERINDTFVATDDGGNKYEAKAVVFATGKKPKLLGIPGEKEYAGKGLSYCAICDGPLFPNQEVAVIGGGNSAIQAALDMVKIASHIYLVAESQLTCDRILSEKLPQSRKITIFTGYKTEKIEGNDFISSISLKELATGKQTSLAVAGVFVEIGLSPNSDPAKNLVKLNENQEITITCTGDTGTAGFFAAGDVTDVPEKQILIAAGEGAKAALRAHRYLQQNTD